MPSRGRRLLARIILLDRHRWAAILTALAGLAMTLFTFREAVLSEHGAYETELRQATGNRFAALRREVDALLAALEQARILVGPGADARQRLLDEYRALVAPGGLISGATWVEARPCLDAARAHDPLCSVGAEARDTGAVTLGYVPISHASFAGEGLLAAAIPFYDGTAAPESVPDRRLRYAGSAVVLFSPREILEQGISYLQPAGLHVLYHASGGAGPPRALARHLSRRGGALPPPGHPVRHTRSWQAGGLDMEILCIPAREWSPLLISWRTWALLLAGLVTTALMAAYVFWMQSRTRRISEVIHRRTLRLRAASRAAKAASRAKSQFLANMSHELRTPIGAIVGMSEMLRGLGDGHFQREAVDAIHASARQLTHLVNNILDYSKLEAGHFWSTPVEFAPARLMDDIVGTFEAQAHMIGLTLRTERDPHLPRLVRADENHLRQILYNLVANALRFTSRGEVVLSAHATASPPGAPALEFTVQDTGLGIDPRDQARIFDAFVQADSSDTRRFGGTGLGLAICRQLVEGMRGELGVESTPGHGSRFWVRIPYETVAEPPAELRAVPAAGSPPTARHLLLVEDNPLNQLVLSRLLQRLGCSVEVAANGRIAIDYCRGQSFDAILMDCQMPELDGYDATRAIRALPQPTRNTPIMGVTASAGERDRDRCLEAGMDDYLAKPVTLDALRNALDRLCPAPLTGTSAAPPHPGAASH